MKTNYKILTIILFTGFIGILSSGCSKKEENPGPISVTNSVTPTTVSNGSSLQWTIKVANLGGDVEIEKIHVREECISGWAQGQGTVEMDLPISDNLIEAHSSKEVYNMETTVYNTGNTDVEIKNTVTVSSNGGSDTDVVIYKVTTNKKKSGETKMITLLSDL
ncbi:MAG: hypothetical protein H8E34_14580 [Bacteroidetes bacterium]|nr:hypothetical protein [Bacteroidota bacterium]